MLISFLSIIIADNIKGTAILKVPSFLVVEYRRILVERDNNNRKILI